MNQQPSNRRSFSDFTSNIRDQRIRGLGIRAIRSQANLRHSTVLRNIELNVPTKNEEHKSLKQSSSRNSRSFGKRAASRESNRSPEKLLEQVPRPNLIPLNNRKLRKARSTNFPRTRHIRTKKSEPCFQTIDSNTEPMDLDIVTVGDSKCGKTALISSYIQHTFDFSLPFKETIIDSYCKEVHSSENELVKLNVWDIGGKEEYDRLRPFGYVNASAVLMCFALDDRQSFYNLFDKWIPEVAARCPRVPLVLVGLKRDKVDKEFPIITKKEIKQLYQKVGARYYIGCSAKEMKGIQRLFHKTIMLGLAHKSGSDPENYLINPNIAASSLTLPDGIIDEENINYREESGEYSKDDELNSNDDESSDRDSIHVKRRHRKGKVFRKTSKWFHQRGSSKGSKIKVYRYSSYIKEGDKPQCVIM